MAVGDTVGDISESVAASGTYLIQPGAGQEWCIHNIFHSGDTGHTCKISISDGATDVDFDVGSGNGAWINQVIFLKNNHYIKLTNTHASIACYFAYTGIQTK